MRPLSFTIDEAVKELGVKVVTARLTGVDNTQIKGDLAEHGAKELARINAEWSDKNIHDDLILGGFRKLHSRVGRGNKFVASPQALHERLAKKGGIPPINAVVYIYNLVSLKSRLALGAHDVSGIIGDIHLQMTTGSETFRPLGKTEDEKVPAGEYSYLDTGDNKIICRMEVLQVEQTKVTPTTSDIFLIVQGNEVTTAAYVEEVAREVCETIQKFCGGKFEFLNAA